MYANEIQKGFMLEFSQAIQCANLYGESYTDKVVYFRFLKAGLGFFCENLDEGTKSCLPSLRMLGIAQALDTLPTESVKRIKYLELPFSEGDNNVAMDYIKRYCGRHSITFIGNGAMVDVLTPIESKGTILAVTNCADPHAAIGNEGGYESVDAAIATNTDFEHTPA